MEISLPLGTLIDLSARLLRVNAIPASTGKVTERLRKSACKFQLEYTNYYFSSSRLHKMFKESNMESKKQSYSIMNELLEAGMKKIFGDLAAQIQNYFVETHRSTVQPRVGIHLVTNDDKVLDIIQLPTINGGGGKKSIKDYTVLDTVIETGKPYLVNDIPRHIKKTAEYKHKGLNINKIRNEYKQPFMDHKVMSRLRINFKKEPSKDSKWCNMRTGTAKGYSSLYKSHIVIPITYRRHAEKAGMNDEMIRVLQLEDNGRSILGFLFVDHPTTYYFHDIEPHNYSNIDINTLVIFADMISFVIVTKLMYTVGSTTVNSFLEKSGGIK